VPAPLPIDVPRPIEAVEVVHLPGAADEAPAGLTLDTLRQAEARLDLERQRLAAARQALEAAAAALADLEAETIRSAETQLVDLALTIARKVLAQEIENGRYKIEPIVRDAIRQAPSRREVVVHLNPQDLATCQQSGAALANVKVASDARLGRGECLVETAEGTVPATVADRFESVAEILKQPT
jgi:flagellar assembly protein FliH